VSRHWDLYLCLACLPLPPPPGFSHLDIHNSPFAECCAILLSAIVKVSINGLIRARKMWRNVDQLRKIRIIAVGQATYETQVLFLRKYSSVLARQSREYFYDISSYARAQWNKSSKAVSNETAGLRDGGTAGQRGSVRIAGERTDPVRSLLRIGSIPKLRRLSTSFSERINQRHSEPIWVSGKRCHYLLDAQ
jgi:hypothetical protein